MPEAAQPAAGARRANGVAWPRPRTEVPADPRARLRRALRLGHRPTAGLLSGAGETSRIQRGKKKPVSKGTKNLLDLGDDVIGEVKGMTKHGAANQQQTVDELQKKAESERRELAQIAYSRTTDFYNKLWKGFGNLGPDHELMENWYSYFMSKGFKKSYYDEEVCSFNRQNPVFVHLLTAYAVIKMGGAVCAQYAPLTALRLAEERPDLKIEIGSGGDHAFALATGKDDTIVVDPWAYAENQKAHLLEDLKQEFQPTSKTVINTGDENGPTAGKTVPTLRQFFEYMEKNESLYLKTFGIDPEELDQDSKPSKTDWNVPTTIGEDIDYVEDTKE